MKKDAFIKLSPLVVEGITLNQWCSLCPTRKAQWIYVEYGEDDNSSSTRRTQVCTPCKVMLGQLTNH